MDAATSRAEPAAHDPRAGVRATFDTLADTYDAVGIDFFRPIARGLVDELAVQPGERALDVGCGRGAALFPLAEAVGPEGHVTGIDLSPRMVELTARDVGGSRWSGSVEVRVGDAEQPGIADGSLDVVASSLVLFFLPDPAAALRAWRQALAGGGRVGVSTFGPLNAEWDVEGVFRPYVPEGLLDPRFRVAGPFASDAGVEELVAATGFANVRTATREVSVRFDDPGHWYRWSMSSGQRRVWDAIPAGDHGDVLAAAAARLDACRRPDGAMGFDQVVRYTLGVLRA